MQRLSRSCVLWLVQPQGNIRSESKQLLCSVFSYQFRWFSPRTFLLHMVNWPVQSSADQFKTKGDLVIRQKMTACNSFHIFPSLSLFIYLPFPLRPLHSFKLQPLSLIQSSLFVFFFFFYLFCYCLLI